VYAAGSTPDLRDKSGGSF